MDRVFSTGCDKVSIVLKSNTLVPLDRLRKAGNNPEQELEKILEGMKAEKVFTPEEAAVISVQDAASYFRSDLGARMLASPDVHREWGFNLYMPLLSLKS